MIAVRALLRDVVHKSLFVRNQDKGFDYEVTNLAIRHMLTLPLSGSQRETVLIFSLSYLIDEWLPAGKSKFSAPIAIAGLSHTLPRSAIHPEMATAEVLDWELRVGWRVTPIRLWFVRDLLPANEKIWFF